MIDDLVKWVVIHQHPFTIVEEPYFVSYIHSLHPSAKIPSADTIKSFISNVYEIDKEKVQNFLLNITGKISFTTDCWTSPSSKSFLSITAHFINKEWKLQHLILNFIEMVDTHTAEHLKEAFLEGLEYFSIENKV